MSLFSFLFGRKPAATEDVGRRDAPVTLRYTDERPPSPASPPSHLPRIRWRDGSFPLQAVGESNYADALQSICGKYTRHGSDIEVEGVLHREPQNPHDGNAVAVTIDGRKVGYLPREQAVRVGGQMIEEDLMSVRCGARIRGGWRTNQHDEGGYGVNVAVPTWGDIDFGTQPEVIQPKGHDRPDAAPSGPLKDQSVAIIGAKADGDLAKELAAAGASIMAGVGNGTTLIVVAEERPFSEKITGRAPYRKAEQVVALGRGAKIVSLTEVRKMIRGW